MNNLTRRSAITASASAACWAVVLRNGRAEDAPATEVVAAVTAPEDLMREHGVLSRLMLVYEAALACRDFVRMFRAHEAWEDTELFPAFRGLVSPARLTELGEQFEEIEHRTFGKEGFANTVGKVVNVGRRVGILGLDEYTPRVSATVSR